MPGFIATFSNGITIAPTNEKHLSVESVSGVGYHIERRATPKFSNDKFLFEHNNCIFLLDGVIFNNHHLMTKYNTNDWKLCVAKMYEDNPHTFYNQFRGSFVGLVYNKTSRSILAFTDHIGDKQLFYGDLGGGKIVVGTELSYMVDTLHLNKVKLHLNTDAAYMLLSVGYAIEDNTLVSEVKKVVAGHYLKFEGGRLQQLEYHRFRNTPVERPLDETIEELDRRFRNAVRLQFEKDKEYGYKHIACLSGGLDSRMTVWVAHDLGYTEQLNMTFSESGYYDFTIAQQIANDLRHDFMYKTLDGGNLLYALDEATHYTYGMAHYFQFAHSYSMFNKINFSDYGIVHTGMIGDVVVGSYLTQPTYDRIARITDGGHSEEIIDRLSHYAFHYAYDNAEQYMMYNRGFGFLGQGALGYGHHYTETYSPFADVDFFEFLWSIPLKWRCKHKIYFEWILQKYPKAAEYIWEKTKQKISSPSFADPHQRKRHFIKIKGKEVPAPFDPEFFPYIKGFIVRRLGLQKMLQDYKAQKEANDKHTFMLLSKNDMNPLDYWYYNNPDLRNFLDGYWQQNKTIVKEEQLLRDMTYLYEDCKATFDKIQPLSLLAAYKLIFCQQTTIK